ncbi:MAG: hypothetical protein H0X62_14685 [Bacteroidetes bacterium]|nr:hypothetical protein [Bacteroidota bacterium]
MKSIVIYVFIIFGISFSYGQNCCDGLIGPNDNKYDENGLETGRWVICDTEICKITQIDTFANGKKNGVTVCYNENGVLTHTYPYKDGELEGMSYSKNHLAEGFYDSIPYRNGKQEGIRRAYYPDGTLCAESSWVDGRRSGGSYVYYKSGRLARKGSYLNGVQKGTAYVYRDDENNSVMFKFTYVDGFCVKAVEYRSNGEVEKTPREIHLLCYDDYLYIDCNVKGKGEVIKTSGK